jgi:hypothetical protein
MWPLMCVPKSILQTESYVSTVLHGTHRDGAGCMLQGPRCTLHVARRTPNGSPPRGPSWRAGFNGQAAECSRTFLRPCAMVVHGGEGVSQRQRVSGNSHSAAVIRRMRGGGGGTTCRLCWASSARRRSRGSSRWGMRRRRSCRSLVSSSAPDCRGIPHDIQLGTVSRTTWYATQLGIPHGLVSHKAWYPARQHGMVSRRREEG